MAIAKIVLPLVERYVDCSSLDTVDVHVRSTVTMHGTSIWCTPVKFACV